MNHNCVILFDSNQLWVKNTSVGDFVLDQLLYLIIFVVYDILQSGNFVLADPDLSLLFGDEFVDLRLMKVRQMIFHISDFILSHILCLNNLVSKGIIVFLEVVDAIFHVGSLLVELVRKLIKLSIFLLQRCFETNVFFLSFVQSLYMGSLKCF